MKIAIMQPYWFPYLGYYKLIASVDIFVFLTDVQYIRRGWINRNQVRDHNSHLVYFTIPVKKTTRDSLINQIEIDGIYWVEKHLKTFRYLYGKHATKTSVFELYEKAKDYNLLYKLICDTLVKTSEKLGLVTKFVYSDDIIASKKNRLIDICQNLKCTEYFNLPGGRNLYNEKDFVDNNIKLNFLNTDKYPKISILDLWFNNNNLKDVL